MQRALGQIPLTDEPEVTDICVTIACARLRLMSAFAAPLPRQSIFVRLQRGALESTRKGTSPQT